MANVCSTIFCARENASARFDSREPRMKGIWRTVLALALSGAVAMPALASALEECVAAGDAAAVLRCLTEEDTKANVELSNAEAAAAKRARDGARGGACRAGENGPRLRGVSRVAMRLRQRNDGERQRRRPGSRGLPDRLEPSPRARADAVTARASRHGDHTPGRAAAHDRA